MMDEEELFYLVCQHPALATQAISTWLESHELTDAFVEKFRFAMRDGTLSTIDGVPSKYFVQYPELFQKTYWMGTKMHYDCLDNEEFHKLAQLEESDFSVMALRCILPYQNVDTESLELSFLERNKDKKWMQVFVPRLGFELVMNFRMHYGFKFTSEGLKTIDLVREYYEEDKRIETMIIRDILDADGELDFTDFLTYGLNPASIAEMYVSEKRKINLTGGNCFALPRLFKMLKPSLWTKGVVWLDYNGLLTKPLLESLFEDVPFSEADKIACKPTFAKYGVEIQSSADDSGFD